MRLLLLPGMDGTGRLLEPLCAALPASLTSIVVRYPTDRALGYDELLTIVEESVPRGDEFIVLGESFSGPLAVMLAAKKPPGLKGIILCASFARSPVRGIVRGVARIIGPLLMRVTPRAVERWMLLGRYQTPELRGMLDEALSSVPPAVLSSRLRSVLAVDVVAELRSCSVPILSLRSTADRLVSSRCGADLKRINPAIDVAVLNAPHLILQAAPLEAARVIENFAASCSTHGTFSTQEGVQTRGV